MKTFRMIGMAIFAVLMSVNFASCSPDDDPTGGEGSSTTQPSNEKMLVRITKYYIYNENEEFGNTKEYKYDKDCRLIEVYNKWINDSDDKWVSDTIKYIWDSNKSITVYWDENDCSKYILANGKITEILDDGDAYYYVYNDKGFIKEYGYDEELENTYAWNNDQLSMIEKEYGFIRLHYDEQTCKGFFPLFAGYTDTEFSDSDIFEVHPELLGVRTSQLPSKIVDSSRTFSFEYELDDDGYISSCIISESSNTGNYTYSKELYEFVWE